MGTTEEAKGELYEAHKSLIAEQEAMEAEFAKIKAAYQEKAKGMMKKLTKAVFENVPQIKTIFWSQYTPYFMDGDPCEFAVNDIYFSNATVDELMEERWGLSESSFDDHETLFVDSYLTDYSYVAPSDLDRKYYSKYLSAVSREENKLLRAFSRFIGNNEDVMEDLFGDHCQVVITEDGVEVEEYDHD